MRPYHCLLILAISLLSCTHANQSPEPEPEVNSLSLEFSEKSVSDKSSQFTIDVTANCDWSFTVDSDWIYVIEPKAKYSGPKTLTINVKKNEDTSERTATLTFTYSTGTKILTVTQAAFKVYLDISEHDLSFGYRAAEKIINVVSNCGWEAEIDADWVTIAPVTGLAGNYNMTIQARTNSTETKRKAIISVCNKRYGLSNTVNVVQDGQSEINDKDYVDEYGVNYGKGIKINGLTWAPENCGYHPTLYPFGKMYQWGRKKGIGYHDDNFNDTGSTMVCNLWIGKNGDENDSSFYKYGEDSRFGYDWILSGEDTFWNTGSEENPIKNSQFDPCPDGWRVPTAFEFKSLIDYVDKEWTELNHVHGYKFKHSNPEVSCELFLPAAGRLNAVDGISYDRNVEGYYWANTADAGNSSYLFIHSSGCSVNYRGSRAGGCSIRCIKE